MSRNKELRIPRAVELMESTGSNDALAALEMLAEETSTNTSRNIDHTLAISSVLMQCSGKGD